MALIKCPECGKEISDKAKTCPHCGVPIEMKFCQYCGEKIEKDCVVCPKCGKQVANLKDDKIIINNSASSSASAAASATARNYALPKKPKNKWTAFSACFWAVSAHINSMRERREWAFCTYSLLGCLASDG